MISNMGLINLIINFKNEMEKKYIENIFILLFFIYF
jgi:hypothetical protein